MKIRTERFYRDGEKQVEEGEAYDGAGQDQIGRALRSELRSSLTLHGIRASWIDGQGRHFYLGFGTIPMDPNDSQHD